jgi:hypothetical protein
VSYAATLATCPELLASFSKEMNISNMQKYAIQDFPKIVGLASVYGVSREYAELMLFLRFQLVYYRTCTVGVTVGGSIGEGRAASVHDRLVL